MNPYYTIMLLAFLLLLAILLIRYVNNAVDGEFRNLARAVNDAEYRKEQIARTDALLAPLLPLPEDVTPLSRPSSGLWGALPPVLLGLGMILLWGGGSARKDREQWLYGGALALALAIVYMLVTMRRRRRARTARLLLFRADLKRLDGNRASSAEDLRQLLRLTPWDDSAWAELSDDFASQGKLADALNAMDEAAKIDPVYDEYHQLQASLAIRAGELERARKAIDEWTGMDGVCEDDPRLVVYRAALQLAGGERDDAAESLRSVLQDHDSAGFDFLDEDSALDGIKDLLPGRT